MNKKKQVFILATILVLLFALSYGFLDKKLENFLDNSEYVHVTRIIDGDTAEIRNNESVRLLGINTPEKGEKYYEEAKEFLESLILNKTVKLEFTNEIYDKYGRILAYIFLENENINVRIVKNGFANYYFYSGMDKYSDDLKEAWSECINSGVNLCEKSDDKCSGCISIETNYITNTCSFSCDISGWEIKGEGRKKFIFNETLSSGAMAGFELDLENSGRSLFLRDEEGKLAEWKD